jgi:Leucine Rich repeat
VIVDAPAEIAPETPPPKVRRKVEELNMNNCCVTAEILEQFLPAVTHGGVRYWDIGRNDFGPEGMEMLAGLFAEPKVEVKAEVDQSQEPARPSTPVSSISSTAMSTASIPPESSTPPSGQSKLEYVSLEGTDLSARQLDPLLNAWLLHPPQYLSLFALDLPNCSLGQDLDVVANLFTALERFPNFRFLGLAENPLFTNANGMLKLLRESLPRLTLLRRIDLNSTGLEAPHLVELSSILPSLKLIAAIHLLNNPIYAVTNVEDQSEGQTEDVSGLTALEAAMRYCRHLIEVELPDGGGVEAARLRHKIFLRCFKNIEVLDSIAHPNAQEDLSESGLGGRKRTTTEEAKELVALQPQKEGRDKYEVDRGYGIARALETVLLNPQGDKAQDMSLVFPFICVC